MTVTLNPHLEARIRERIDSGRYGDASEVVEEALRLLEEREHAQLEHLRSLLAVGIAEAERGELIEFTPELMEEIARGARQRLLCGDEPDPDVCP
jgi:antitoxin ParD1/3/4